VKSAILPLIVDTAMHIAIEKGLPIWLALPAMQIRKSDVVAGAAAFLVAGPIGMA